MPAKIHLPLEKLRQMIEDQELQQHLAAEALGVSVDTVRRACQAHGIRTQRTGPRGGDRHPDWKGGRKLVGGYWYIYRPEHPNATKQRYVAEHRLVMEEKLGRYLDPKEVVHHRDGNSQNNHPDNLEVFRTNGDHLHHSRLGLRPNWTPEGKDKILRTLETLAATRRQRRASDGHPRTQTTDHLTE